MQTSYIQFIYLFIYWCSFLVIFFSCLPSSKLSIVYLFIYFISLPLFLLHRVWFSVQWGNHRLLKKNAVNFQPS